jgi:hypothetical protein
MAKSDEIAFIDVPDDIARAFRRGLEDVKHGRVVSVEAAIAEGRRYVAEYGEASAPQSARPGSQTSHQSPRLIAIPLETSASDDCIDPGSSQRATTIPAGPTLTATCRLFR